VLLQWCHSVITVMSQWCYSGVTVVLWWCYIGVTSSGTTAAAASDAISATLVRSMQSPDGVR
jgi:hypothetical protein